MLEGGADIRYIQSLRAELLATLGAEAEQDNEVDNRL